MKTKLFTHICAALVILILNGVSLNAQEPARVKIRDIASIEGVRENQLVGFGLVTGLRGQGDSTRSELVKKMLANLMQSFGVQIEPEAVQSKNSAAVVVTTTAPTFATDI